MAAKDRALPDLIGKLIESGHHLRRLWKLEKPVSRPRIPRSAHSCNLVHLTWVYGAFLIQDALGHMQQNDFTNKHISTSRLASEIDVMEELRLHDKIAFCDSRSLHQLTRQFAESGLHKLIDSTFERSRGKACLAHHIEADDGDRTLPCIKNIEQGIFCLARLA